MPYAFYKIYFYAQIDSEAPIELLHVTDNLYETDFINYDTIDDRSHTIYLGEIGLPQNQEITVTLEAFNNAQYNNNNIYNNTATDSFTLVWGDINNPADTSRIALDEIDILPIINHVLEISEIKENTQDFKEADVNSDGIIDVVDIAKLINKVIRY